MKFILSIKLLLSLYLPLLITSARYPINEHLDNSTGTQSLVDIENRKTYVNYTKNSSVIALFHSNICRYCDILIEMFMFASSYPVVKDWSFLRVNCSRKQLICSFYNITMLPTIKVYVNKTELFYKAPHELGPLLEFLRKLSSPPLVEINEEKKDLTQDEFYKKYDKISPVVEYYENDTDFYNCIKKLGNGKYRDLFYFGMKKIYNETNPEKIIFDYWGAPFMETWDGNCTKIDLFLEGNKFPLLTNIDNTFLVNTNIEHKVIVMLFGYLNYQKTKDFIFNEFKLIAHDNRSLIFCYANYPNTSEIHRYFNVKLYSKTEIKLVIFDFKISKYYVHPIYFDMDINTPEEIDANFRDLLSDLSQVTFTTGYFIKDLLFRLGVKELSSTVMFWLVFFIVVFIAVFTIILSIICKKICPTVAELDENITVDFKEENEEDKNKDIKEDNKLDKENKNNNDTDKINNDKNKKINNDSGKLKQE